MESEIRNWIHELRQNITHANLNYEIWWVLFGKDTDDDLIKVLNKYKRLQLTLKRSYMTTLFVDLYKLYETKDNRHCIPSLIKKIEKDNLIDTTSLDSIKSLYAHKAKPIWVKVSILRNNVYAHSSSSLKIEDAFERAKLSPNDLKDLLDYSKEILNSISKTIFKETHVFNLGSKREMLNLLKHLNEYHTNRFRD